MSEIISENNNNNNNDNTSLSPKQKRALLAAKLNKLKAQKAIEKVLKKQILRQNGGFDISRSQIRSRNTSFLSSTTQKTQDLLLLKNEFDKLFDNQLQFGLQISQKFNDLSLFNILALALTQCGKTGSMLSLIYHSINMYNIPINNVFIISGYSSKLWIQQTKERMPECIQKNIFHRNTLPQFVRKCKNRQNVLIITDETHIASLNNQALHKAFRLLNLFDIDSIYKNDIKIVNFTATPDGLVPNIRKWKFGNDICIMPTPSSYRSIFSLYDSGKILQCKELCGHNKDGVCFDPSYKQNILEIAQHLSPTRHQYHLIRTPNGKLHEKTIHNFETVFEGKGFRFLSETKIVSLDALFKIPPETHTFIFIKEKLRCAKTLDKTFIGVLYERNVKRFNDSAIIQGFAGRMTGFHDHNHFVIFSNIDSIKSYRLLWSNAFSYDHTKYIDDIVPRWVSASTLLRSPFAKISAFYPF